MALDPVVFTGQSIVVTLGDEEYLIRHSEPKQYTRLKNLYMAWRSNAVTEAELLEQAKQETALEVYKRLS